MIKAREVYNDVLNFRKSISINNIRMRREL